MPELKYISFWDERYAREILAAEQYARIREHRIANGVLSGMNDGPFIQDERHRLGKGGYFKRIREEVGCCEDCGATDSLEAHHKTPLDAGGSNRRENIKVLCTDCHSDRH